MSPSVLFYMFGLDLENSTSLIQALGLQPNTIDALLHDLHSYTVLRTCSRWRYIQITSDKNQGALLSVTW